MLSRYVPAGCMDSPYNYEPELYEHKGLSKEMSDHARNHFTAVLSALYGKDSLDLDSLAFWLTEVAYALDLDYPSNLPNIER